MDGILYHKYMIDSTQYNQTDIIITTLILYHWFRQHISLKVIALRNGYVHTHTNICFM